MSRTLHYVYCYFRKNIDYSDITILTYKYQLSYINSTIDIDEAHLLLLSDTLYLHVIQLYSTILAICIASNCCAKGGSSKVFSLLFT